jgi:L-alanine-DL-glutamate epimerase-like enolase superfamily enzyme
MEKNKTAKRNRRALLKGLGLEATAAGLGMMGVTTEGWAAPVFDNVVQSAYADKPMKIVKVESVRFSDKIDVGGGSGGSGRAEFCWVRLHTDSGIIGTGETYPGVNGELGALKDFAKRFLLGKDPRDIDGVWQSINQYMSMRNSGGADMHILSAINMAQLDILGQSTGLPLYRLLGGKTRSKIKVYNTTTDYWAINNMKMGQDTAKIVRFLLDRGVTGMKIYPFNEFSFMESGRTGSGQFISSENLEKGLTWLKQIRETAGDKMEILIDAGGRWNLTSSQRILKAIEPYKVIHFEDIQLPANAQQAYATLAAETSVPIAHSETIATRYEVKDFLQAKAMDILMYDLCWCGGPSEAKRMSDMADAYNIPTSPHTAGGPLLWLASIHVCTAISNFCYMESNYWKYTHQYPYFLKTVPVPENGYVTATETPGLGAEIRPELFSNGDAIVETIEAI